jgi:putative ABC transport system substrate-binding protein
MSAIKKILTIVCFGIIGWYTYNFYCTPKIAIISYLKHESIKEEINTFKERCKNYKVKFVDYEINPSNHRRILSKISSHYRAIVTFSTPATRLIVHNNIIQKDMPILFSSVSDPLGEKIVNSFEAGRHGNIVGVSDGIDLKPLLHLIQSFTPHAKKIGIIYTTSEINSTVMLQTMMELCKNNDIELIPAPCVKDEDLTSSFQFLKGKVDVIYVPCDNRVVFHIKTLANLCEKNHIPLFTSDSGSVKHGALAAYGYDRQETAGHLVQIFDKIQNGEKPGNINISTNHQEYIFINNKILKSLKLSVPSNIKNIKMID